MSYTSFFEESNGAFKVPPDINPPGSHYTPFEETSQFNPYDPSPVASISPVTLMQTPLTSGYIMSPSGLPTALLMTPTNSTMPSSVLMAPAPMEQRPPMVENPSMVFLGPITIQQTVQQTAQHTMHQHMQIQQPTQQVLQQPMQHVVQQPMQQQVIQQPVQHPVQHPVQQVVPQAVQQPLQAVQPVQQSTIQPGKQPGKQGPRHITLKQHQSSPRPSHHHKVLQHHSSPQYHSSPHRVPQYQSPTHQSPHQILQYHSPPHRILPPGKQNLQVVGLGIQSASALFNTPPASNLSPVRSVGSTISDDDSSPKDARGFQTPSQSASMPTPQTESYKFKLDAHYDDFDDFLDHKLEDILRDDPFAEIIKEEEDNLIYGKTGHKIRTTLSSTSLKLFSFEDCSGTISTNLSTSKIQFIHENGSHQRIVKKKSARHLGGKKKELKDMESGIVNFSLKADTKN